MKTKTNRRALTKLLTLGFLGIAGAGLFNAPNVSALPLTDLPGVGDWSNNIFNPSISHIDYNTTDGEAVDTNLGAIVLEIFDEEGNAVPGAVFEIDGVRALRTMKSYVYNKDFGLYSQFTTDGNGCIAIENVPYGTYTVRFVSGPDGQAVTEPVKTIEVDEKTTASVQYQHPQLYFADNEFTDSTFVSPTGATYLDIFDLELSTNGGIEVAWDETAGGYVTPEEIGETVITKKDNNAFEFDMGVEVIELKKITGNLFSANIKAAGFPGMGGEFSVQENSNGTVSAVVRGQDRVLSQGDSGCYPLDESGSSGSYKNICKENGIYLLNYNLREEQEAAGLRAFVPMRYDEQSGKYIFNDPIMMIELVEGDDGRALLLEGFAVQQDPDLHIWTLFDSGLVFALSDVLIAEELPATFVSFKATEPVPAESEESDKIQPINPQTGDIFLPAAVTIIAFTSAAVVTVKRSTSR